MCGRWVAASLVWVRDSGQVAHFSGLRLCGSVWACPCCAFKIAAVRVGEITTVVQRHLDLGGAVLFLTMTCGHRWGDGLAGLLRQQQSAWHGFTSSKTWRAAKARYGVEFIRCREVTDGDANGWHPHYHVALLIRENIGQGRREELEAALSLEWRRQLEKVGLSGSEAHALRLDGWDSSQAKQLGSYLAKSLALETAGGTFKSTREGRRTPWGLLDTASQGETWAIARWHEYEQATLGQKFMSWSAGARALRQGPELTDEEVSELEVGGQKVVGFDRFVKEALWALSPRGVRVLELCEVEHQAAIDYVHAHAPPGSVVVVPDG